MRVNYIHSDVDTMERVKILEQLRRGEIDVLVGVNLLREGLDLPEVSLVAILDADKSGFLRDARSLTQTAGRAARNVNGLVIMYGDTISDAMREVMEESERRRSKQMAYNREHNITPQPICKAAGNDLFLQTTNTKQFSNPQQQITSFAAENEPTYGLENETIDTLREKMERAARNFDFILAARYRDEILKREKNL